MTAQELEILIGTGVIGVLFAIVAYFLSRLISDNDEAHKKFDLRMESIVSEVRHELKITPGSNSDLEGKVREIKILADKLLDGTKKEAAVRRTNDQTISTQIALLTKQIDAVETRFDAGVLKPIVRIETKQEIIDQNIKENFGRVVLIEKSVQQHTESLNGAAKLFHSFQLEISRLKKP